MILVSMAALLKPGGPFMTQNSFPLNIPDTCKMAFVTLLQSYLLLLYMLYAIVLSTNASSYDALPVLVCWHLLV